MYQDIEMALATVIEFRGVGIEVQRLNSWEYSNDNSFLTIYEGDRAYNIKGVAPDEYNYFLNLLTLAGVTVISYNPLSKSIARMDGVKAVTEFNENQRKKRGGGKGEKRMIGDNILYFNQEQMKEAVQYFLEQKYFKAEQKFVVESIKKTN